MESIREQMDLSNEISDAISNPVNMGIEVDDVSTLPNASSPLVSVHKEYRMADWISIG